MLVMLSIPYENENEGQIRMNQWAILAPSLVDGIILNIQITILTIAPIIKCKKKFKSIALPYYLKTKLKAYENGMIAQPYKKNNVHIAP